MILWYFDAVKYENPFFEFFRFWGGLTPPNENEGGSGPPRFLRACYCVFIDLGFYHFNIKIIPHLNNLNEGQSVNFKIFGNNLNLGSVCKFQNFW